MQSFYPGLPNFSCHNLPKWGKYTTIATKLPNGSKIFHETIKYTNVFHFKALQHLPKFGFLV
jgi:hypothetical protein